MKLSALKTIWIVACLSFYTAMTSLRCINKYYFSKIDRNWTDKVLHHWVDLLLQKVKVNYKVFNPFNTQPQIGSPTILMSNHSSAYDIPLAFKAFPKHSIRMLAKKELQSVPLMGKGMTAAEFPFVDRKNRFQALKDLARVKELMKSGIIIWIAPEGTRSKNGQVGKFKKGPFITAIETSATIIPIGIRGAHHILPAGSFNVHTHQDAEIHIGEPIEASLYHLDQRNELAEFTRKKILELCNQKE